MKRDRFYVTERELFSSASGEHDQSVTRLPPIAVECEHCGENFDPDKADGRCPNCVEV